MTGPVLPRRSAICADDDFFCALAELLVEKACACVRACACVHLSVPVLVALLPHFDHYLIVLIAIHMFAPCLADSQSQHPACPFASLMVLL